MNRRGFLSGCLAASTAPAFIKSESLMGLWVPKQPTFTLEYRLDGTAECITDTGYIVESIGYEVDGFVTLKINRGEGVILTAQEYDLDVNDFI